MRPLTNVPNVRSVVVVALLLAWLLAGRGPCGGSTLIGLGASLKDPGVGLSTPCSPSLAPAYNCCDPGWEQSQLSPPGKHPKIQEDSPSNSTAVLRTQRFVACL